MSALIIVIPILIAASLATLAAVTWPRTLVMLLPFLVVLDGVSPHVGGVTVRLDQAAALLLTIPLAGSVLLGTRRLRVDRIALLLLALLAANVLASVRSSPVTTYSLSQCANLASVWVIYVLLLNFLDSRAEVDAFLRRWVWAGIAASTVGIAAYLLALGGMDIGGAEVSASAAEHLTNAYGAYGTLSEPNLFGSFTASQLVLATTLLATGGRSQADVHGIRRTTLRWLAVTSGCGLVLSFTRAAWIGAIAAFIGLFIVGRRIMRIRIRGSHARIGALTVILAIVVVWFLPGSAGEALRFKVTNFVNIGSQTAVLRLASAAMALQQTVDHPWIGWGTFTFAPITLQGADFQHFENWQHLWIGNFLLLALHDTGVIGLAIWLALLATLVRDTSRALRVLRDIGSPAIGRLLALALAVVAIVIPFLATTGFSLGFSWLLIGLLAAESRLAALATEAAAPSAAPAAAAAPLPALSSLPGDAI